MSRREPHLLRNGLFVMVVAGKAAVHTFRAEPAVTLDRRALRNECGQVVPLAGLVWNTLAPGTKSFTYARCSAMRCVTQATAAGGSWRLMPRRTRAELVNIFRGYCRR